MRFIGIDLAWKLEPRRGSTAIAVLDERGRLIEHALAASDEEIVEFAKKHCSQGCVLGIDAPLVVKNRIGMRECDRALLKMRGIPTYPASRLRLRNVFGGVRGEALVSRLNKIGIFLRDALESKSKVKAAVEVYPYAALAALFGRGINYKRGKKSERIAGIRKLVKLVQKLQPRIYFGRKIFSVKAETKISELKSLADLLDALLAAYVVFLFWAHGKKRCEVFGSAEEGFMVVPRAKNA